MGTARYQSWRKVWCVGRSDCKTLPQAESARARTRTFGEERGWTNPEAKATTGVPEPAAIVYRKDVPAPKPLIDSHDPELAKIAEVDSRIISIPTVDPGSGIGDVNPI